ncbi:glycogen/starch/alpha-glucan phosphorylase [Beggiatoa alba B18LD]|uniref:Alpha-1,4 glucan phosphorylase n=1 Tax=Beggiatoa alba B18LD TaxID=395493 RepID=I3CDD7_9GAMM|nr:glycogen/starch/alpha-glucan phosphorylase [Beggiatoa alba]EIJ41630.1 glycogen/starch/alpha-glucan phosphorylase [Beggiatoa alba B18LD]
MSKPDIQTFVDAIRQHLSYSLGVQPTQASLHDLFMAVGLATRNFMLDKMFLTEQRYAQQEAKRLYYLSMEFLVGRSLANNLYNLGLYDICRQAVQAFNVDFDELLEVELDAALGNGGLGRLAACFLDSLATLDMPGYGYGINYEYGLFKQDIIAGKQVEKPDHWLIRDTPWLIERQDYACFIPLYGRVVQTRDRAGKMLPTWVDWKVLIGVPHDMPIVGYSGNTVNYLRLYSAMSSDEFDMNLFNAGDYIKAVEQKISSENISKVLYPSDQVRVGKELRLIQEYFFIACAIRDVIRIHREKYHRLDNLADKVAFQLNDTHPALAIAELMRTLTDEYDFSWKKAWEMTVSMCGYTNHTLLPEALEKWSVALLEHVLPRHLQIIYEINHRFLQQVALQYPSDVGRLQRMSIIEEGDDKQVRMANLAIIGSHSINGVAAIHSDLVKKNLVPDFYEYFPERFNNKTNGVTPRRWLLNANPALAELITQTIGTQWTTDLSQLRDLEAFCEDSEFQAAFLHIKRTNKQRLATLIAEEIRVILNPDALFDIQIKRLHEYKRQLLNAMHIIHQYLSIVEDGVVLPHPKVYIFAGKAAPGYFMAKLIINLINNLAEVINHDPRVRGMLNVIFMRDYKVSLAEKIIPAADLSEQISTAGMEASGTGNMKFAMNGALTIGTLDGANVEIREEVGAENIYIFGLKVDDIARMQRLGSYKSWDYYHHNPMIRRVMDAINTDRFCPRESGLFKPIFDTIMFNDRYYHLADLDSYIQTQAQVLTDFGSKPHWAKKAILNVARMGKFSSDRTINEYAREIWGIQSIE